MSDVRSSTTPGASDLELQSLNRALRTILACRRRMAQAKEEVTLLEEICQVLVEEGGYRMAWVGYVDEELYVRPVVFAGVEDGYLSKIVITIKDEALGHGPTGTAIRTGKPSVGWDLRNDARVGPWREELLRHGFLSSIALPLVLDGAAFGALTLYSDTPGAIDDDEVRLLIDLVDDLAFRIRAMQTSEALKVSERRYRLLFERSLAGVAVTTLDGKFQDCNEAFAKMFGYSSRAEVLVTRAQDLYFDDTHREQLLKRLQTEGIDHAEYLLRRKDGSEIWVMTNSLITDIDGANPSLFTTVFDITDRKRSEDDLRKAEEEYRSIFELSVEGIFQVNQNGKVLAANPACARILGYDSPEQLIREMKDSRTIWISPERRERLISQLDAKGVIVGFEAEVRRKDGGVICISLSGVKRLSKDKVQEVYEGFMEDITERKALELQFLQAQKMEAVGRLAGGVAHDFNNVLAVIAAYSELVLAEQPLTQKSRERLEEVSRTAYRAANITRQLLAFSRKQVLEARPLDINTTVRDMVKMLDRLLGEDIRIVTRLSPDIRTVIADPTGIDQILMNLAVNARDAMAEGGTLTISTSNVYIDQSRSAELGAASPGDYVLLAVTDTGTGIPKEIQNSVFEPFFTTKEMGKGTGLGLATVYGVVEYFHGLISIDSEVGKGTTFNIYFPRAEDSSKAQPTTASVPLPRGTETILLVEDELAVLRATAALLRDLGYSVIEASSAAEAIHCATSPESATIGLLVTDVVLPDLDGLRLAEHLRMHSPELRVLFVSGYTDNAIGERVANSGSPFIQKPFSQRTLAAKLRDILDGPGGTQTKVATA